MKGNKAEKDVMKKIDLGIPDADLIKAYDELKSCYKVADKFGTKSYLVKRALRNLGVLRSQNKLQKKGLIRTFLGKSIQKKIKRNFLNMLKNALFGLRVRPTLKKLKSFYLKKLNKELERKTQTINTVIIDVDLEILNNTNLLLLEILFLIEINIRVSLQDKLVDIYMLTT